MKNPGQGNKYTRTELGRLGEDLASEFLRRRGYRIIKRNHRIGHSDIDILAEKNGVLIFTEVRTRSRKENGMPEESLTYRKLQRMKKTALMYMGITGYRGPARLDAVCIITDSFGEIQYIRHYKSV